MVRKLKVQAAAVDIERFAKDLHAHGGAFDVPAGAAGAPRAIPARLAGLGPFPEGEVAGVAFTVADLDACAGFELLRIAIAQFAIVFITIDIEVNVAARRIGKALGNQPFDQPEYFTDVLGGARHLVDAGHAEPLQIADVIGRNALGKLLDHGLL